MHRSSGRAYNTVGGSRTVPWYNMPTPMGIPKTDPWACTNASFAAAPNGERYQPTIPCGPYNPGTQVPGWLAWGMFLLGKTNVP